MDKVRNECIRGSLKVAPVMDNMSNRLALYGHIMREECHVKDNSFPLLLQGYETDWLVVCASIWQLP